MTGLAGSLKFLLQFLEFLDVFCGGNAQSLLDEKAVNKASPCRFPFLTSQTTWNMPLGPSLTGKSILMGSVFLTALSPNSVEPQNKSAVSGHQIGKYALLRLSFLIGLLIQLTVGDSDCF